MNTWQMTMIDPPYCNLSLKNTWPWKIAHVDFSVPIFQKLGFSRSNWQLSRFHLSSWVPSFFHSWELPLPSSWVWLGVAIEINVNVRSIGEEAAGSCECRWSLVTRVDGSKLTRKNHRFGAMNRVHPAQLWWMIVIFFGKMGLTVTCLSHVTPPKVLGATLF